MPEEKNQKAKFFCESCGAQVPAKARVCPTCGRFFSSVRCPRCGFTGMVSAFTHGCPKCHYAMSKKELYGFDDDDNMYHDDPEDSSSGKKKKRRRNKSGYSGDGSNRSLNISEETPTWLFMASIVA